MFVSFRLFVASTCCIWTLFFLFPFPATAQVEDVLRIAVLDLAPYGYVDEQGNLAGLNFDLGNRIAIEAGFIAESKLVPVARALDMLKYGEADMCILLPSKSVARVANNAGLVLPIRTVVWGRTGTGWHSVKDLEGLLVAQIRGANYDDRITGNQKILKYYTSNYTHCLEMLMHERVDAVVGPLQGLTNAAKKLGYTARNMGTPMILSSAPGSAFVPTSSKYYDRIRAAVQKLKAEGTFEAIGRKYAF